jgi:hypothetical protein
MVLKEPQPVHAVVGNCGQWHGRERTYITVNDRRICYDTAARSSPREMV